MLWPHSCTLPTLRPTHFFSTAISFSRLLSRNAGDFLMHFRAKSFPVTLCFTRKTSEKAPLSRRHEEIKISTAWLGSIVGGKTKGRKEDVADHYFPLSLWAPDELLMAEPIWHAIVPSFIHHVGNKRFCYGFRDYMMLFPGSIIKEGLPETLLCFGEVSSLGKLIKERRSLQPS